MNCFENDPSKNRERRRLDVKKLPPMTPERRAELQAKYPDSASSGPRMNSRNSAPIHGTMDAVSVAIYENRVSDFVTGPSSDFLFPVGSGRSFNEDGTLPRQLRQGGWIYLRDGKHLVARVQYKGVEHRDRRIEHVSSPDGHEDRGPGLVLAVDPTTWQQCVHPLRSPSESGNGYRYYTLEGDHPVWTRTGG